VYRAMFVRMQVMRGNKGRKARCCSVCAVFHFGLLLVVMVSIWKPGCAARYKPTFQLLVQLSDSAELWARECL
jgi:hypothetical protein